MGRVNLLLNRVGTVYITVIEKLWKTSHNIGGHCSLLGNKNRTMKKLHLFLTHEPTLALDRENVEVGGGL